ncbi:MAG: Nif3-like dinuclear metal center hexameric protein, partial [bacterium]|nr:Nif3-like dinuclear metal center hexameric protein [bacterium]
RADFRGQEGVAEFLNSKRKKYERLPEKEKQDFDKDSLENPYSDSGIHNLSDNREIKRVLAGIDIDSSELLIAKYLGNIDLVIGHHPIGKGLANLADVMNLQCDVLNYYGVPINIAEGLMKQRISEVARGVNPINHQRVVDSARLIGLNLMNIHTPADNLSAKFLKIKIDENNPKTLGDVLDLLKEIAEYKEAMKVSAGPRLFTGSPESRCGKIALTEITGGTEGSPKLYEKMANAGIGTIIGMHVSEEHKKEAENAHLNVVIAGHISSDSLGMNLFLDELEKQGIEIIPCSGFTRISRVF